MSKDASAQSRTIKPRLSVQLAADKSSIDWSAMKPETRDTLRQLLASPEAQRELGVPAPSPGATEGAPDLPTAALMGPLFDALGLMLVGLAQRAGYTETQARVLLFSVDEKDTLVPLTSKVLDKYFPDGFGAYQDEIALAVVAGGITMRKLTLLRESTAPAPRKHENTEENRTSSTAH